LDKLRSPSAYAFLPFQSGHLYQPLGFHSLDDAIYSVTTEKLQVLTDCIPLIILLMFDGSFSLFVEKNNSHQDSGFFFLKFLCGYVSFGRHAMRLKNIEDK
jgi:hypothetical protein